MSETKDPYPRVEHINHILEHDRPAFSFEFSPPRTPAGAERLYQTIEELAPLGPSYVSVTYGAGGSTRELTHDVVLRMQRDLGLTVVAHLTCVGASRAEIGSILGKYYSSGIRNIMAIRGDPPLGETRFVPPRDGFAYAAELVAFIKREFPDIGIGVAGYPEGHIDTPNRLREIEHLKAKVDAGADYVCTQLFYDNRDYFDFCERCALVGVHVPILAGIMPITSRRTMHRMAELALGSRYPAGLLHRFMLAEDDERLERAGIEWATEQVRELVARDIRGVHFYTLNLSKATASIYRALGLARKRRAP
ncbi:MAG: methylenetetrahydrofolate reductase [NAD(P)H] [Vicinamibacteria bacterium]|nr:methylenetetrahydrofolate reductase [NAD(P)H] [Vicinamibacteria bacterium]